MRYFLKDKKALAHFGKKASSDFWDEHWEIKNLRQYVLSHKNNGFFIPIIKRFLPAGATILEGGCGRGQLVHAMQYQGYKAIGIDFAPKIVKRINQAVPMLDIKFGDVRNLPIESGYLDGYISLGVIEHFWEGYSQILAEMKRTIRKGGYLFVSFPYMSPLRKLKVKLKKYPISSIQKLEKYQNHFYQFVFDAAIVKNNFEKKGFTLVYNRPFNGLKGLKDEVLIFRPILRKLYNYDGEWGLIYRLSFVLSVILAKFSSHSIFMVFKKNKTSV